MTHVIPCLFGKQCSPLTKWDKSLTWVSRGFVVCHCGWSVTLWCGILGFPTAWHGLPGPHEIQDVNPGMGLPSNTGCRINTDLTLPWGYGFKGRMGDYGWSWVFVYHRCLRVHTQIVNIAFISVKKVLTIHAWVNDSEPVNAVKTNLNHHDATDMGGEGADNGHIKSCFLKSVLLWSGTSHNMRMFFNRLFKIGPLTVFFGRKMPYLEYNVLISVR